jgi:hypothetical protein
METKWSGSEENDNGVMVLVVGGFRIAALSLATLPMARITDSV